MTDQPTDTDQPSRDKPSLDDQADIAALMIAAADDRDGMAAAIRQITVGELPALFLAALEVGGSLVRLTDRGADRGEIPTTRDVLRALIESCREQMP